MENTVSETPTTCPIMEKSHDNPGTPSTIVGTPLSSSQTQLGIGTSRKKKKKKQKGVNKSDVWSYFKKV